MACILARYIRPGLFATSSSGRLQTNVTPRSLLVHKFINQNNVVSASTTNYHYHEKPTSHSHDKLWKAERYLSLALLGILPAAAVIPHPIMDYAVALSLVVHVHWGVEAIVIDYVRPSIFGPTIPKISIALVYLLSSLAVGGLFCFNYTDVGITQATRMLANI